LRPILDRLDPDAHLELGSHCRFTCQRTDLHHTARSRAFLTRDQPVQATESALMDHLNDSAGLTIDQDGAAVDERIAILRQAVLPRELIVLNALIR
jgi:hypothetical protein